jgi:CO/xanthine dehydrogenase Mo-binding subunit
MLHPRSLGTQILGGSIQGMGIARSQKWVYDPAWGVAFAKRLYTARPPGILDVPLDLEWGSVELPDPQTPVGAKGIGEPPVGAGSAAIVSAISDALGGICLCRTRRMWSWQSWGVERSHTHHSRRTSEVYRRN